MTIIICPTERCNFKCTGCFEPQNQRSGFDIPYSYPRIKQALEDVWAGSYNGSDVCLHGGEPTLINRHELERLFNMVYNLPWKRNDGSMTIKGAVSIVTNGSMIDDDMIRLFKKYNVYVGLSCDGPPDLNIYRGPAPSNREVTKKYNIQMGEVIKKLRANNVNLNIMCILHSGNASTKEQLKKLAAWMLWLKKQGITGGRVNPMYSNDHPELELTNAQLYRAWNYLYRVCKHYKLKWNPLYEMEQNLQVVENKPCVFARCDKFATHTLSILPDGTIGNCDRTFSDGLYLRSMDGNRSGRYEALAQSQCKGCRYWTACYGGCPEEGVNGDWRNKTRFCEAIYKMYEYIEKQLKLKDLNVQLVIEQPHPVQPRDFPHGNKPHGDDTHGDKPHGDETHGDSNHGNIPHGDKPHGDSHFGDMPDWERP